MVATNQVLHQMTSINPDFATFNKLKQDYTSAFREKQDVAAADLPYFKILPKYLGSFPPGKSETFLNFTCFQTIKIETVPIGGGAVELTIEHEDPDNILCHRSFIVSTGSTFQIDEFFGAGKKTYTIQSTFTSVDTWDIFTRGPRVFMYPMTPEDLTYNLAATAALFEPVLTEGVSENFANMNREFLSSYAGIKMELNDGPGVLHIPEELIGNGDTFNIMRLDGLDPMIAWAMGAATGHTGIALWRNETLYICESNAKSAYWPVNGIQCNLYKDWIEYGRRNGYNVVWVPLKEEIKSKFDSDLAWDLIETWYGIDYGYEVVLMGLLDTMYDNMPCVPTAEGDMCIEPEHFEMLFSYIERVSTTVARVYKPAMLQRAGVPFNYTLVEAFYEASLNGLTPEEMYSIPEQDGWLYETTRDGVPEYSPVAICNVFVCNVWKTAGIFGELVDLINCGETSVNDNYRLNLYKPAS
ncbi:uncharacterized protein LOC111707424 isoform X2 [Eurytemora carolleeae]|uniref:uncharacterized protein LOC111707424 isoform X2 n=1 Tax=Eurytemora carolleeae TaxID=1294199 RepID=UPI000C78DDAB|nr:uncharacterized protein LOC111707424 isoform X2 [Eurytemora carolleeae]|eukprot:XP_023336294.1 uncharacterized protein LOC111707424 isoform X2 [Eurytemora affinis]